MPPCIIIQDTQYRVYVLAMDADSAVHYLCEVRDPHV